MIKLFASDLDGTLLNGMHETDRTIRSAIQELMAAGLHVVPATGRTVAPTGKHGFTGLQVDSCCANGGIVRSANGEVLKTCPMDPAFVEELLTSFPQMSFDVATPDGVFVTGTLADHEAGFKNQSLVKRIVYRGMRLRGSDNEKQFFEQTPADILKHVVCKINAHRIDESASAELDAFLAAHTDTVINAPFDPGMFEITDKDCNKGASIAWLANYYGIAEDECAVYGDGGNDIAMLKRFKHSYATRGASDAAKAAASETIGSCIFHAVPRHMLATMRAQQAA